MLFLFPRPRRPQPDNTPTYPCRHCSRDVPAPDDRPRPWCPHCGESLAEPDYPAPQPPPRPEPPPRPREETYHPWAVMTTREPAEVPPAEPPPAELPAPAVAEPPAVVAAPPTRQAACAACGCAYQVLRAAREVPCPTCGLVAPVEAFRLRFWGHLACAVVGTLALLAGEYTRQVSSPRLAAERIGPALAVVAVMHLLLVASGLRRHRYEDRETAKLAVTQGVITVLTPGGNADAPDPSRPAWGHWLAVVGLCLAPCWLFAPAAYQQARGWPANEGVVPDVVGPGDEVTVTFADHGIVAGRGPWSGQASAEVLNARPLGVAAPLTARPVDLDAGDGPSVRLRLPASPQLGGAALEVRVTLTASYPRVGMHAGQPRYDSKVLTRTVRVELAAAGCQEALAQAWAAGWLATGLTYLASAGAVLAVTRARRPAWPGGGPADRMTPPTAGRREAP